MGKQEQKDTTKILVYVGLTIACLYIFILFRDPITISWVLYTTVILCTTFIFTIFGYDRVGNMIVQMDHDKHGRLFLALIMIMVAIIMLNMTVQELKFII